jgi:branched-subunit amino acid aminotransferase/4-amino-4-deoxychorismate lyase
MSETARHTLCLINSRVVGEEQLRLSLDSSAIAYGTGCFETFAVHKGRVCDLSLHLQRLQNGLAYLGCHSQLIPSADELTGHLSNLYETFVASPDLLKVRIQAALNEAGGYSGRGGEQQVMILMEAMEVSGLKEEITLITSQCRTLPPGIRPLDLKLSNMLHYRDAFRKAADAGADDALLLSVDGSIAETSISNIFWKRGDRIYTPSRPTGILPGITRNRLIIFFNTEFNSFVVEEGEYLPETLDDAESVWVTNSLRGIRFVRSIDGRRVHSDHIFEQELTERFSSFGNGVSL